MALYSHLHFERTWRPASEYGLSAELGGDFPNGTLDDISPDLGEAVQIEESAGEEPWSANAIGHSSISTATPVLPVQPEIAGDLGPEASGSVYLPMQFETGFSPGFGLLAALFGFCVGVALLGGAERLREVVSIRQGTRLAQSTGRQ